LGLRIGYDRLDMKNLMMILSQLFWGVTVGALTETALILLRGALAAIGLGGATWWGLRWRRGRRKQMESRESD